MRDIERMHSTIFYMFPTEASTRCSQWKSVEKFQINVAELISAGAILLAHVC